MRRMLLVGGVILCGPILWVCSCSGPSGGTAAERFDEKDPLSPNGACYVCHTNFVGEQLSRSHLKAKVACTGCHGLSEGHANDKNIGATPPDRRFSREQVRNLCGGCHERQRLAAEKAAADGPTKVCTDCHGTHRIKADESRQGGEDAGKPKATSGAWPADNLSRLRLRQGEIGLNKTTRRDRDYD